MTRVISRSIAAVGAATLLFSGGATLIASHASASTTPPWEVGATKDVNEVGTLALYTSGGVQVTSGSVTDTPIAAYLVGSKSDTAHPKATAFMYTPHNGTPAGAWSGEQMTLSTSYPVTGSGVPAVVSGTHAPVVTGHNGDETIGTYIEDFANSDTSTTDGYGNAYQLRVKTSTDGTYQSLDIVVSGLTESGGVVTGGTWTETYPGVATVTSTALKVSPSGSVNEGKNVTLRATESATGGSHAAGTVQFADNGKKLGKPVAVNAATGVATLTTSSLLPGKHSITATFAPGSPTFGSSGSKAVKLTVVEIALANTKKPTPSGPHKVGKQETVSKGSWSPKATSYSYQWYLGSKKIKKATHSSLKLTKSEAGKKLSCTVTAKRAHYKSATAKSKGVTVKK
jgi:hypothetical protein